MIFELQTAVSGFCLLALKTIVDIKYLTKYFASKQILTCNKSSWRR
jgi:hypothetical protein